MAHRLPDDFTADNTWGQGPARWERWPQHLPKAPMLVGGISALLVLLLGRKEEIYAKPERQDHCPPLRRHWIGGEPGYCPSVCRK